MLEQCITALPIVDEEMNILWIESLRPFSKIAKTIEQDLPVIIMAGGKGSRLKPYTDIIPKPLIPIGDKTITEHIIERFVHNGLHKFYLIINYKKKLIETYFSEEEPGSRDYSVSFIEEPYFMGTAGGIALIKDTVKDDFFLTNCDILIDCDYYSIWKKHTDSQNMITMVCVQKELTIPYGTILTDQNDQVIKLEEKPSYFFNINAGFYLCNKNVFNYITEGEICDMPALIERCISAGEKVGIVQLPENNWMDMGQLNELEKMRNNLK